MKTINVSMTKLNGIIDAINGAIIGVSKSIEVQYDKDAYTAAMQKLSQRINGLLQFCEISDKNMKSYIVSALEVRTMRFSKNEVKVLSGTAFRKWFKTDLFRDRLGIDFVSVKEKKPAIKKSVKVSSDEYAAFKAWKAAQK